MRAERRTFWIHVDRLDREDGRVWAVQTQGQYLTARHIDCGVPVETHFRGCTSRQPKAYLKGKGTVMQQGSRIVIR